MSTLKKFRNLFQKDWKMFSLEGREGGTLMCDMVDVCDSNNIEMYLLTIDIGKAFDSLDHKFPAVLKKWFW